MAKKISLFETADGKKTFPTMEQATAYDDEQLEFLTRPLNVFLDQHGIGSPSVEDLARAILTDPDGFRAALRAMGFKFVKRGPRAAAAE